MKGPSADKLSFNITSFQFSFTPLQITAITRPSQKEGIDNDSRYYVQLQKGAQVVRRFGTKVELNNTLKFYFHQQENVKLTIFNPYSSSYGFAIYKQTDEKYQYVQSLKVQLLEAFDRYVKEIKHKKAEYKTILQKIQFREDFRVDWKLFKASCSKHNQVLISKNLEGAFELKYLVQIKGLIDFLAENKQPKIKFSVKRSHDSEKRSSSSKNSKGRNNEHNAVSTEEKTMIRVPSQFKLVEQIKEDRGKSEVVVSTGQSRQSSSLKEDLFIQSLIPTQATQQNQECKVVPFIPLNSILKKNEILSDIVEASYQGDSQMNSGGDKTDRKWKEMPEIKQQDEGLLKRKTYHYLKKQVEFPVEIRRNNSLSDIRTTLFSQEGEYIDNGQDEQKQKGDYETSEGRNTDLRSKSIEMGSESSVKNESNLVSLLLLFVLIYVITTAEFLLDVKKLEKRGNFTKSKSRKILKTKI